VILFSEFRHFGDVKLSVGPAEVVRFFQDGDPRKPGLIDLKDQAFEEQVIIIEWEPVLGIVIILIERIFRMGVAVFTIRGHGNILLFKELI